MKEENNEEIQILVNMSEVKKMVGFKSNSAVYNLINNHKFPKPVKVGPKRSMWVKSLVVDWIDNLETDDSAIA